MTGEVKTGAVLRGPLRLTVEADEDVYLARTVDLPLYGVGAEPLEAVGMLLREVRALYGELMEDDNDNVSDEWLRRKAFLRGIFKTAEGEE